MANGFEAQVQTLVFPYLTDKALGLLTNADRFMNLAVVKDTPVGVIDDGFVANIGALRDQQLYLIAHLVRVSSARPVRACFVFNKPIQTGSAD